MRSGYRSGYPRDARSRASSAASDPASSAASGGAASRDQGAPPWAGAAAARPPKSAPPLILPGCASTSYLSLDFETTGLDPSICRVVEIGAIRFSMAREDPASGGGWRVIEEASLASLVDPGVPMPAAARAIHGIRDEDLVGAPSFASLAPVLLALAEGATIVAHNAPFDLSFLDAELSRLGLSRTAARVEDTVFLAKRAFPGRSSYRLGSIASSLGIDVGSAHRALDDARTCMMLYRDCARLLK